MSLACGLDKEAFFFFALAQMVTVSNALRCEIETGI